MQLLPDAAMQLTVAFSLQVHSNTICRLAIGLVHYFLSGFRFRTSNIANYLQASHSKVTVVGGNQLNYTVVAVNSSPSLEYVPPQRVNDAPIDLLADNFQGRLKDLDFLSQAFAAQDVATKHDIPTRCVVYGMPGLGKTKLALRFAEIVFTELLYSHIFWMSAATSDKLTEGMAKILDLVGHAERTRSEQNAKLTAARLWLEDSQRIDGVRWLLILDNVDKGALEFLRGHLPRRNVKGDILFTTRAADVADALVRVSGGRHSKLELRVPDLVDATHLLFSSAGIDASTVTPTEKNQAEELIQNLGSLPLAIVQAASYMRQTDMTLDGMLEISKGARKIEMIEWESDLATDQQRSVVATFDTLLDQLERDSPESYDILRILSFLDPEYIPLAMITDGARTLSPLPGNSQRESRTTTRITEQTDNRSSSQHGSGDDTSDPANPTHQSPELRSVVSIILSFTAFPKTLHKLRSLSLVEPLTRDGERFLRMHDLIHFMTREHVQRRTAYRAWLESAVSIVCGALRRVEDPRSHKWWPECEKMMPHVDSLRKAWTGMEGVNLNLANADVCIARYLNGRGRYDDVEELAERSYESFRKELGDKHNETILAYHLLAQIHYNQGRYTQAEEAFKGNLAVREKELGPDHHDTLATMNGLALVYRRQDRHKEAEDLFKRILAVKEKNFGRDQPQTLTTMHNLAVVYRSQTRIDDAEELFTRVLSLREKHLGPDHVDTLTTVNNLASLYEAQTKYNEAEELFKRALAGREKLLGASHFHTLTVVSNLARLYQLQERNDEAEKFFLRALTGRRQQLAASHPETLRCAKHFAAFYRSLGRNAEADALLDSTEG